MNNSNNKTTLTDAQKTANCDEKFMRTAIKEAHKAAQKGEIPVGALVVLDGKIIARGHNLRSVIHDATAHAEVVALRKACKKLGRWNLFGCDLYVTLEPCAMCAGAAVNARIRRVVFGAYDHRFGCTGTLINIADFDKLNHRAEVIGGVLQDECSAILTNHFKELRAKNAAEKNDKAKDICLQKAEIGDSITIHKMQKIAFAPLLQKYQDLETSPALETPNRVKERFNYPLITHFFILKGKEKIGSIRIRKLDEKTCKLVQIFILPQFEGKGYAQKAIIQLENLFPNVKKWELDTIKQEEKLCYLYEKLGYVLTAKKENIKDGMDLVFYEKYVMF